MSGIQCPYCQCEITLVDAGTRRLARAALWFCLGAMFVGGLGRGLLPALSPPATDPQWVSDLRQTHKNDPAKAEDLIAKREASDRNDWVGRLSPTEKAALQLRTTLGAICIMALCVGVPCAILAMAIHEEPQQKRPPPHTAGNTERE
jgi:hypothetical protein